MRGLCHRAIEGHLPVCPKQLNWWGWFVPVLGNEQQWNLHSLQWSGRSTGQVWGVWLDPLETALHQLSHHLGNMALSWEEIGFPTEPFMYSKHSSKQFWGFFPAEYPQHRLWPWALLPTQPHQLLPCSSRREQMLSSDKAAATELHCRHK